MPSARIEVAIAAHYVRARVPMLAQSLRAIAGWSQQRVSITIATNNAQLERETAIADAAKALADRGYDAKFEVVDGLEHPHHLTWHHKQRLSQWCALADPANDWFVYLEDDIELTRANLDYFLRAAPEACKIGCIPGFVRYELGSGSRRYATDFLEPQLVATADIHQPGTMRFVEPRYPYWAGFIVNRELCEEYLASPWLARDAIEQLDQLKKQDCRAQSAFGVTYVNAPRGHKSRVLIPVTDGLEPHPDCQVHHSANNYVTDAENDFASIPLEAVFRPANSGSHLILIAFRIGALLRQIKRKLRRALA